MRCHVDLTLQSMNIFQLTDYAGSRDYDRLAELAKAGSLICMVDYQDCRDVAHTIYQSFGPNEESWTVSARGTSYVWAQNKADFIARCARANLEFIEPPQRAGTIV